MAQAQSQQSQDIPHSPILRGANSFVCQIDTLEFVRNAKFVLMKSN